VTEDPESLVSSIESSDRIRTADDLVENPRESERGGLLVGTDGPITAGDFPDEFAADVTLRTQADQYEVVDGVREYQRYDPDPGEVVVEEAGGGHPDGHRGLDAPFDRRYSVEGPEERIARVVEVDAVESVELERPMHLPDGVEKGEGHGRD